MHFSLQNLTELFLQPTEMDATVYFMHKRSVLTPCYCENAQREKMATHHNVAFLNLCSGQLLRLRF